MSDHLESIAKTQEEPVGEAGTMPGTSGFTMAAFEAEKVPVGTKLYISAPPSPAVTALELENRALKACLEATERANEMHMKSFYDCQAAVTGLVEALERTWKVIDAAGLNNLVNGVQLGQVAWLIKAEDARAESTAALAAYRSTTK